MDECATETFAAIYLCGVSSLGYKKKTNYPHNLHAAIFPRPGASDDFSFEDWHLSIENGIFTRIPQEIDLPAELRTLDEKFTTCRIFRWAACILPALNQTGSPNLAQLALHPQAIP